MELLVYPSSSLLVHNFLNHVSHYYVISDQVSNTTSVRRLMSHVLILLLSNFMSDTFLVE